MPGKTAVAVAVLKVPCLEAVIRALLPATSV